MINFGNRPCTDHNIRFPVQYRLHQEWDIIGIVLIVGVSIDDHIGAQFQTGVQTGHKSTRQALVFTE